MQKLRTRKLSAAALPELSQHVAVPSYDRSELRPGIVHIGVGNFHRAHQAWYLHRLMQQGGARDWAILGAGVRAGDEAMRQKLAAQDNLTTLIELAPDGRHAEIIGSMIGFVPVSADNAALIAAMSAAEIRIVSLTVTEGGYFIDPETGGLDQTHPDILHDAAHPHQPRTAFGAIIEALRRRREAGRGPFTVQSCDNLQGNGAVARRVVVALAGMSDPDLAAWIDREASFPDSMVDCIVPATGPEELALAREFGIEDAAPVTHEDFRQWVIEDDFCAGRPDWQQVGVTLTSDVHAHEAMKIRLLNAGHQVLANAGELLGVETISGCMNHASVAALFHKVEHDAFAPYVDAVPGMSAGEYIGLISRRFANPAIRDTTRRVAFDGSSRHPGFILPILRDALAAGGEIEGFALVEALWARMCAGTREDGSPITPNDPQWDRLTEVAQRARTQPQEWLDMADIYSSLGEDAGFAPAFDNWLRLIWNEGVQAAIAAYCEPSRG